ncbi:MAG: hypothetical protein A4E49_02580 [Methanosaeta sp. PtaU1.Bin112]|nr:MAG: hypothetical protein A4E49_02580 [Methanosaeta sp. PtaU1.Bin112]
MLNDVDRMRSGDMDSELIAKVDKLIDEFMEIVNGVTEDRHLQRGIARSQLPCSAVAILDRDNLSIMAQFRTENKITSYYHRPEISLTPQRAANNAQWEFGFTDAFVIQIPADLIGKSASDRHSALQKIASEHVDSEFLRFESMLSLMRTRPIFGNAPEPIGSRTLLLLQPQDSAWRGNEESILNASRATGMQIIEAEDIRSGRSAVRDMWQSINYAAVIIADLTGADAGVMYGLGIAHTLGKETILIHPQGSKYLTDIPRTYRIEYEENDAGRAKLMVDLTRMLEALLAPVVID